MIVILLLWSVLVSTSYTPNECHVENQDVSYDAQVVASGRLILLIIVGVLAVWLWMFVFICCVFGPGVALLLWFFPSIFISWWLYMVVSLHAKIKT